MHREQKDIPIVPITIGEERRNISKVVKEDLKKIIFPFLIHFRQYNMNAFVLGMAKIRIVPTIRINLLFLPARTCPSKRRGRTRFRYGQANP